MQCTPITISLVIHHSLAEFAILHDIPQGSLQEDWSKEIRSFYSSPFRNKMAPWYSIDLQKLDRSSHRRRPFQCRDSQNVWHFDVDRLEVRRCIHLCPRFQKIFLFNRWETCRFTSRLKSKLLFWSMTDWRPTDMALEETEHERQHVSFIGHSYRIALPILSRTTRCFLRVSYLVDNR